MKRIKSNKTKKTGRENVGDKTAQTSPTPPHKNLAERLGISPELLLGEVKVTVTGDYLVEIVNHKGIISLSEEQIEVNTRKYVYKIQGKSLMIASLTDEELTISGNLEKIEKL